MLCFIHTCPSVRHPSLVISRPLQSLPFTPIRLSRAVDTDFCVPTVLNKYSPGKWLTETLFVGNSLSTAHYHDLWSASVIRRPLKSLPDRFWLTMDDGRRMTDQVWMVFYIFYQSDFNWSWRLMTEADDGWFDGQVWMGHYTWSRMLILVDQPILKITNYYSINYYFMVK